jgi:hypothetical protein
VLSGERTEGVVAEGPLERRRGLFLLRMADHDRGVDVDDQHVQIAAGDPGGRERPPVMGLGVLGPHDLPRPGPRRRHRSERGVVEPVEQPPARRVRGDLPEQRSLIPQDGDLSDRRRAVGDRDGQVHQHPARGMAGARLTQPVECLGELAGQRGSVRDIGQQPGADMRDHPGPVRSHDDLRTGSCSLHLESASSTAATEPSASPVLPGHEALSSLGAPINPHAHEEPGLAVSCHRTAGGLRGRNSVDH